MKYSHAHTHAHLMRFVNEVALGPAGSPGKERWPGFWPELQALVGFCFLRQLPGASAPLQGGNRGRELTPAAGAGRMPGWRTQNVAGTGGLASGRWESHVCGGHAPCRPLSPWCQLLRRRPPTASGPVRVSWEIHQGLPYTRGSDGF